MKTKKINSFIKILIFSAWIIICLKVPINASTNLEKLEMRNQILTERVKDLDQKSSFMYNLLYTLIIANLTIPLGGVLIYCQKMKNIKKETICELKEYADDNVKKEVAKLTNRDIDILQIQFNKLEALMDFTKNKKIAVIAHENNFSQYTKKLKINEVFAHVEYFSSTSVKMVTDEYKMVIFDEYETNGNGSIYVEDDLLKFDVIEGTIYMQFTKERSILNRVKDKNGKELSISYANSPLTLYNRIVDTIEANSIELV